MSVRVLLVSVAVASVLRLAQTAAGGSTLPLPAAPHDATAVCPNRGKVCRHTNRGDQGGSSFALPCHEASAACPCTPFPPALLTRPRSPARWIAGGVAAKTAEDHCALEEANAALEELRGPYRLALAYREGLAVTVIAAAAVGATLWLCVLIARAHLLGYIYVLLCYVIVPWTVLRCLTAPSLDANSVSWCVLVLVCVCRGYFTVPM